MATVNEKIDYAQALNEASRLKYFNHLSRIGNSGIRAANLQSRVVLPGTAIGQILDRVVLHGKRLGLDLTTETVKTSQSGEGERESRVQLLEIPEGSAQTLTFPEGTAAALTPIKGNLDVIAPEWDVPIQLGRGDSVYVGPQHPSIRVTSEFRNTTALLVAGRDLPS